MQDEKKIKTDTENSKIKKSNSISDTKQKVRIAGYISLVIAILFFSGIFKDVEGPLRALDFTNVLGSFGKLGTLSEGSGSIAGNFRGTGGAGVRDGWLFALTLAPAVMLALGVVKIVEDLDGLKAAQNLLSPLLRPCLGIPGFCGLALIASLQSTDAGSAMTRALYDKGFINDKEALIFTGFQFSAGALLTNYLSSGAGLFVFLEVPIFIPLVIIFLFKFLAGNIIRLYAMRIKEV
jgi:nucleoside recognition membrane protein YjiH